MVTGLWGKKIGMTQLFVGDAVVPVTAIDCGRWVVTTIKNHERDGYQAVQVGCVKKKIAQEKFSTQWLKKPKQYFEVLREVKTEEKLDDLSIGKSVESSFLAQGDTVSVTGITKGCGFAGVVRRYNFGGPPGSHGATMGNRPGSIGTFATQGKVVKGKKMPGRMGNQRCVMRNLEVVQVNPEEQVVLVKGSVPGKAGSLVFVRKV